MMHFKIIYWNEDEEPTPIEEDEYAKAIRAQIKKTVFLSKKHGSISGADIKKVTPDYERENKIYNPSGADFVPREVRGKYESFMEHENENIERAFQGLPALAGRRSTDPVLPNPSVRKYTQGPTALGDLLEDKV